MPASDRLLSPRTFLQIGGILVLSAGVGLAVNATRTDKPIAIGKQHFGAALQAQKAARDGTGAAESVRTVATGTPPSAATTTATEKVPAKSPGAAGTASPAPPAQPGAATPTPPAPSEPVPAAPPPPVPEVPADGIQRLTLADCKDLVGSPIAVFVDARDGDFYRQGHIPGAIHLYHYDSAEKIDEVLPELLAAFMVIVYCNGGDCEDSLNLAFDLVGSYGVPNENVSVFEGGMDEWKGAGLPVTVGEER